MVGVRFAVAMANNANIVMSVRKTRSETQTIIVQAILPGRTYLYYRSMQGAFGAEETNDDLKRRDRVMMTHLYPVFNRPSPARRRLFIWVALGGILLGVVLCALDLSQEPKSDLESTREEKDMAIAVSSLVSVSEIRPVTSKKTTAVETATFGMG